MNPAYKHLDSKLRIAEFTVSQWLGVVLGLGLGIIWGFYLSPFGPYLTLASAIYVAAIPIGAVLMSTVYEVDVLLVVRSAVSWSRLEGRFIPGPGEPARGYVVVPEPLAGRRPQRDQYELTLEDLWQS